jgi:MFS transporter, FHS family, glucose/mannose:H+ symporter
VINDSAQSRIRPGWLSAAAYAGMFGFGIVMALLGAVLPLVAQRLQFDLSHAGELFLFMNAAMLVTTLALGPVVDRFGHKAPLVIAPLFVASALRLISTVTTFRGLLAALVLLGVGGGALNQVTNTLIADLYEDARKKRAGLNVLGIFFGFGALFVPFTIGSLFRYLGLEKILYLAMALSLVPTVLGIPFVFPPPHQREGVSLAQVGRLVRQPLVLTFSLLLFFESGNEFILGGYITMYLTSDLRATISLASYLLAAYWGALMLGRVLLSRATLHRSAGSVILGSALAVAASMTLLLTVHSISIAAIFVILLGFSIATIFPTVLGLAGSSYATHSGTVFGILIGLALGGGMTLPWLVGKLAEAWGVRTGLFVVIFNALAVFVFQLVAQRILRRR